jgi:hypothetical protein
MNLTCTRQRFFMGTLVVGTAAATGAWVGNSSCDPNHDMCDQDQATQEGALIGAGAGLLIVMLTELMMRAPEPVPVGGGGGGDMTAGGASGGSSGDDDGAATSGGGEVAGGGDPSEGGGVSSVSEPPTPTAPVCTDMSYCVNSTATTPTGAGHCAGEVVGHFGNTCNQKLQCRICPNIYGSYGNGNEANCNVGTFEPGQNHSGELDGQWWCLPGYTVLSFHVKCAPAEQDSSCIMQ